MAQEPKRRRRRSPLNDRERVEGNGRLAGGAGRRSRSRSTSGPRITGTSFGGSNDLGEKPKGLTSGEVMRTLLDEAKWNPRQPRDPFGRWTDLSTVLPSITGAEDVPPGWEETERTRTRAGVDITHIRYTGGVTPGVRELLKKRRLRDLVREELAVIAWNVATVVTGGSAAAKDARGVPHPLLVEMIAADLQGMADRDEDFDDGAFNALVNRYRAQGYGPQEKGMAVDTDTLVYEHKALPVSGFKVLDKAQGIVECIVSVTGIVDEVSDVIEPGAYAKTLQRRTPKGVYSHDWNTPVAKTLSIKELLPGDPDLPATFRGKAWPSEAGALVVKAQFNLGTQRGSEAYSDVEFYGTEQEWSIGYNVPVGGAKTIKGVRYIKEIDLFEFSPVLFGAMPLSGTLGAKAASAAMEQAKAHNGGEMPRYMTVVVHTETKDVYAGMVSRPGPSGFGDVDTVQGKFCDAHGGQDPEVKAQCAATGRCALTGAAIEEKAVDKDPDPSPNPGASRLREYWVHGEGAGKIRWGTPGDFNRCVRQLTGKVSDPKGLCNVYHRAALGAAPGQGHGDEGKSLEETFADYLLENQAAAEIEEKAAAAIEIIEAGIFTLAEIKRWDPKKHPRDYRGRFVSLGDVVDLPDGVGGGGNERGKVVGMDDDGKIEVEKDNGDRVSVDPSKVVGHGKGDDAPAKPSQGGPSKPGDVDSERRSRSDEKGGPNPDDSLDGISIEGSPTGTGTKEDPISVGSDVDKAAALLAEGKHVRLDQPDQVATLLDRLTNIVNEAKEKGEDAPNFDLCMVSVPKTNLFCAESKGIPRAKMPQLSGTPVPGSPAAALMKEGDKEANIVEPFREALARKGIKVTPKRVKASHLRASQAELDGPKIAGMSKAMEAGKVPEAAIFVTRDGYIIDGHHRWASKVAIDVKDNQIGDVEMPVDVLDMDIGAALDFANEFALAMGIRPKSLGAAADGVAPDARNKTTSDAVEKGKKDLVGGCAILTPEEKVLLAAEEAPPTESALLTLDEVEALQRLRAELA